MSACLRKGMLTISIDLKVDDEARAAKRSLEPAIDLLLRLLTKYRLPATWSLAHPGHAAISQRLAEQPGHEIGLLGEGISLAGGSTNFSRQLGVRVQVARASGLGMSSLVLDRIPSEEYTPALVRHGITAVRHPATASLVSGQSQPRTLRHGVWSFPVTATLPGAGRWLPGGGGGRAARTRLERAVQDRGLFQLAIDAGRLTRAGYLAERTLERVLAHAAQCRGQHTLEIASLAQAAARLAEQCQMQPSRSILRPAA